MHNLSTASSKSEHHVNSSTALDRQYTSNRAEKTIQQAKFLSSKETHSQDPSIHSIRHHGPTAFRNQVVTTGVSSGAAKFAEPPPTYYLHPVSNDQLIQQIYIWAYATPNRSWRLHIMAYIPSHTIYQPAVGSLFKPASTQGGQELSAIATGLAATASVKFSLAFE
ncbi:hypothetical protein Nepgr_017469 [Nepenthes gracilis]|uniref:Uncharacterized protein n=1 Tax=Nepenthes gracilis TaxID=150966 RepID=A0AAD3XSI1_NEPGR|nr:hypothetical protein Nepgr_017469 [Nepenthes gracilis]